MIRRSTAATGGDPLAITAPGARPQPLVATLALVTLLLVGLPLAVWLDLRNLSERLLNRQADEIGHIIDDVRNFYATNVVGHLLDADRPDSRPGEMKDAIPIPATFSIELGHLISDRNDAVSYRFVSDFPFKNRAPHKLDEFERQALATFRATAAPRVVEVSGSIFDRSVRMATPVVMGQACVACHATHPDSPKRDWKVGDVRGIQVITMYQPLAANILAFKYLLIYFVFAASACAFFIIMQRRQSGLIQGLNHELAGANEFLAGISMKISKYLSPQVYKSIFTGEKDVAINTERKKLTIFFSDIKDFTATTERMQPEDLTALLNEYLTEMSNIALAHGGTVDKFVGDAILVFFGDPETKGVEEDARACLRMAVTMQHRLSELDLRWRERGIENPFTARMGINTGYCNVGNFGSADRMDYTIIGAEANLAARLQSIAEPGKVVLSYETYALVSDMVSARAMEPITMKGISRQVIPYVVDEIEGQPANAGVIKQHRRGLNFFLDVENLDRNEVQETRRVLQDALSALDKAAAANARAAE
jgi:adenylate cyclase